MAKEKILIVDDEEDILELLEYNLLGQDFKVFKAHNGMEALEMMSKIKPNLILLDIMMPHLDGIETCRRIKESEQGKKTHVIFLTARAEEFSELAGFEAGAVDYICKPVKPRILISRIKAVLGRDKENQTDNETENTIVQDLEIVRDEFMVYKKGKPISLPKKEFELLEFLASRPGKVFTREVLLEQVWGSDVLVVDRTIDVHIRKLREKIGKKFIQTIKGVGYKFVRK